MPVGVRRGPDDHLGALPRRGEPGGVAVLHQLLLVLLQRVGNEAHWTENGLPGLVGGQGGESPLRGQLDVHAQPVRQQAQPGHELLTGPRDGLGVDIAVEPVVIAQKVQAADHPLSSVVRADQHAGGQEQSLDIVPAVKLDGQLRQLLRGEHRPACVVGAAVDAVLAVVDAAVGHQHLQQGHAPPVAGKGVAASGDGGGRVADMPRLMPPLGSAGGTGGVIFGRVGQNGQFLQDIHRPRPPSPFKTFVLVII